MYVVCKLDKYPRCDYINEYSNCYHQPTPNRPLSTINCKLNRIINLLFTFPLKENLLLPLFQVGLTAESCFNFTTEIQQHSSSKKPHTQLVHKHRTAFVLIHPSKLGPLFVLRSMVYVQEQNSLKPYPFVFHIHPVKYECAVRKQ